MFKNIGWGFSWGMAFAAFYSLYVLLLYTWRGPEPFDALGITIQGTIVVYFAGGAIAGVFLGTLRRFLTDRPGATVAGIFAAFPLFISIAIITEGYPSQWDGPTLFSIVISSAALGAAGGNIMWTLSRRDRHP